MILEVTSYGSMEYLNEHTQAGYRPLRAPKVRRNRMALRRRVFNYRAKQPCQVCGKNQPHQHHHPFCEPCWSTVVRVVKTAVVTEQQSKAYWQGR